MGAGGVDATHEALWVDVECTVVQVCRRNVGSRPPWDDGIADSGGSAAAPFLPHIGRRPGAEAEASKRAFRHGSGRHAACPIFEAPASFDVSADFGPFLCGVARSACSARSRNAGRGRRRGGVRGRFWANTKCFTAAPRSNASVAARVATSCAAVS